VVVRRGMMVCMSSDSEPVGSGEQPKPPPTDKAWLEVENIRGDDPGEEGTWPFVLRDD
jgi:hypothetical protein